jgi:hypothetical protein
MHMWGSSDYAQPPKENRVRFGTAPRFPLCALRDSVTQWLDEKLLTSIDALLVSLNLSRRVLVADAVKNTPESDAQVAPEEAR